MSKPFPSLEKKRGGMSNRQRMEEEEEEAKRRKQQQQAQLPAIIKETKAEFVPPTEVVLQMPDGKTAEINKDTKGMVMDAWHECEKGNLKYSVLAKWFINSGRSNEWFTAIIEHRHRDYYFQLEDGTKTYPLADKHEDGRVPPFERLSRAIAREARKGFDQLAFSPARPPPPLRAKQSDRSLEDEKQKKLLKEQTAEYNKLFKQAVAARKKDIDDHPVLAARSRLIEKRSKGLIGIQNLPSKIGTSGQVDNEEVDYGIRIDSLSVNNNGEEEEETY